MLLEDLLEAPDAQVLGGLLDRRQELLVSRGGLRAVLGLGEGLALRVHSRGWASPPQRPASAHRSTSPTAACPPGGSSCQLLLGDLSIPDPVTV